VDFPTFGSPTIPHFNAIFFYVLEITKIAQAERNTK